MKYSIFFLLWVIMTFFACNKEEHITNPPLPAMSVIPKISLISAAPSVVQEFKDSIVFTIEYEDGDGNIGFEDADSMSVYVTDKRVPLTEKFYISPLTPNNQSLQIKGKLHIVLDHTILFNASGQTEQVTFAIKLRDRANNWSNEVTTQAITVQP
jgi:hypothetical protein